jgi:maltooligosyltrehalose trehalohydrolase
MHHHRRLPVGAEVQPSGGVHYRVWAPVRRAVEVVIESGPAVALQPEDQGYFSGLVAGGHGTRYRYRLDDGDAFPDPASRFQSEGPHGASQVVDPSRFAWTDQKWRGTDLRGQVLYELHVGTFTRAGTWEAAARELPELAAAGITVLEVMPVAEFPGKFGWGYDGVNLFAPTRLYGDADDFRRFVDRAHAAGLGVILDVVYNHIGPDGNYLTQFAPQYFTDRYKNEWGEAINFDGPEAGPVREYFVANAGYWIAEFHLDGLRLDATQQICDASSEHILTAIGREVRRAAAGRATIVVAENEEQHAFLARPVDRRGYGLDGLWNDDFHHSAMVALTGHAEAYYSDYRGDPQEFIAAAKWGYLYQGQYYTWQKKPRGTPALDLPPDAFVTFLQNHDQVANSVGGLRAHLLSSPGRYRALTALMLLGPGTPMLFQGQEFASSSPFLFFADHNPDLAKLVRVGRAKFLSQFLSIADPSARAGLPDPADPKTFERCKLDFTERELHREMYDLHRDLIRLRREDPAFRAQRQRGADGAVLGPHAFLLRFFAEDGMDRLLLVNLGRDQDLGPGPSPLLAPPEGCAWAVHWSSEAPRYGGGGAAPLDRNGAFHLQGEAAVVLVPRRRE